MMTSRTCIWSAAIAASAFLFTVAPAWADGGDRLSAEWWQHSVSIPSPQNPILDESGTYCGIGQRGNMWFLHGTPGNPLGSPVVRECTVPADQHFFVPILNFICTPFAGETIEDNIGFCADAVDQIDLRVLTVDGKDRSKLIKRRVASDPFPIQVPAQNYLGFPAGVYDSVADGYWAQLPPLPVGHHTIHFQGGITSWLLYVDVIYHIDVVEPGVVVFP